MTKSLIPFVMLASLSLLAGCGKKDEPAPPPKPVNEPLSDPAASAELQQIFDEQKDLVEHEKTMRDFGVDVQERPDMVSGNPNYLRIILEERKGERLDAQVYVLQQYVEKGRALLDKHQGFFTRTFRDALYRESAIYIRGFVLSRIKAARNAIDVLNGRRREESLNRQSLKNMRSGAASYFDWL